ncbi:MAG TPA: glycerol-3-phosphate 1-O-acyltransferase PlsY [bacterium]|nr:glycerol-3-phosphate 1-O-acyltransferase PlsY [bacterium]
MINNFIVAICSYLIGSIPTAYIIGNLVKKIDIRNFGSGNVGATNVFRVLGARWGIITLILDMLKGFIPVYIVKKIFNDSFNEQLISGAFVVIGHIFTIFLKFSGGKGVASAAGFLLAFTPIETIFTLIVFIAVFAITHIVSLGSIIAAISYPIIIFFFKHPMKLQIFSIILALLIIVKHKKNIERLIKGEEKKIK